MIQSIQSPFSTVDDLVYTDHLQLIVQTPPSDQFQTTSENDVRTVIEILNYIVDSPMKNGDFQ